MSLLRTAVVGGTNLLHGFVHFAVDVIYGVRWLEDDLGTCLLGLGGDTALDHHVDEYLVAGVYPLARDEAVESGQLGDDAYVRRDEKVQHTEALVALLTLCAEPAVSLRDLDRAGKLVAGVVAVCHDVGLELIERRERAQTAALLAIAEAAAVALFTHGLQTSGTDKFVSRILHYNTFYLANQVRTARSLFNSSHS